MTGPADACSEVVSRAATAVLEQDVARFRSLVQDATDGALGPHVAATFETTMRSAGAGPTVSASMPLAKKLLPAVRRVVPAVCVYDMEFVLTFYMTEPRPLPALPDRTVLELQLAMLGAAAPPAH